MRQTSDRVSRFAGERLPESTLRAYGGVVQSRREEGLVPGAAGVWALTTRGTPGAKRVLDMIASALLLLASAPLWPIIAVLTKLESPGPVFIRQSHAGRLEEPSRLLKFRSMREAALRPNDGAASLTREAWSAHRTTRLGRLLRRTALDELPQVINVLLGTRA